MRLSRSVLWNAAGVVLPLAVGVLAMPATVRVLGIERFGVLSVVWMVVGYFSVFDLGLGRTLTKMVADRLGSGDTGEIPKLVSTTLYLVLAFGAVFALAIWLGADWLAARALHVSVAYRPETVTALHWLALSLPFVLAATALFGLLEAFQKFALVSAVRLPLGVLIFLSPLAVSPLSVHLGAVAAVLFALRAAAALVLLRLARRLVPELWRGVYRLHRPLVVELLRYGGWLTVTNLVGPVMVYFDRFLIAALMGTAVIAYYTVPYDALTRLWVIPSALQGVLFPAFATLRLRNPERVADLFAKASGATALLMVPAFLVTMLLGYEGLNVWMGPAFAAHSTHVAQILMFGVLANSMARIPFVLVQGAGHARWAATVHLLELPVYLVAVWWLVQSMGVTGAAYAWSARSLVDALIFYRLALEIEPRLRATLVRDGALLFAVAAAGLALTAQSLDTGDRWVLAATVVAAAGIGVWWNFRRAFGALARPSGAG